MLSSERDKKRTTVAELRRVLDGLDPNLTVVVRAGIGYEEATVVIAPVLRPVLVPRRYLMAESGDEGVHAVLIAPVNR